MKKVIISVDSAADLPQEFAKENGIEIMPMLVVADGKTYRDGIDINGKRIFEYVEKTGVIPKTSAVSPGEYMDFFEPFIKDEAAVIHLSFCGALSSTYRNAVIASARMGDVFVLDTKNLGGGISLLALKACEMRDNGMAAEEIYSELKALIPKTKVSYLLDSVEFLRLGGRCSALSALGASLFSIKPCAGMVDGKIEILSKYKGKTKEVRTQYVNDLIAKHPYADKSAVFIYHSGVDGEELEATAKTLREAGFKQIITAENGSIISLHSAPNALGVHFMA